jgi:hypothetical protein
LNLIISLDFKLDLGEIKMSDIVELFRSYSNKKISENLLRELKSFKNNWIKKRESHINFLGGNLLGPDEIIFSDADRITYFDIIGIYEPKELPPKKFIWLSLFFIQLFLKDFSSLKRFSLIFLLE